MTVPDDRVQRRRAIVACLLGNLFELYDFTVYGFLAIQIGHAIFPATDPLISLLASFATYGTGFLTRPLGAMVLGSFGDRHGRKAALSITITLMALATGLTGLVPGYASIGLWAPVLMVSFRLLQGFSTGGEWGGATTFLVEYAPPGRRGFFGSLQQLSTSFAQLLAIATALMLNTWLAGPDLAAWGWRIPFLIGFVLAPIGYYVRSRVAETPEFEKTEAEHHVAVSPLKLALTVHRAAVLTCFGLTVTWTVGSYIFSTFLATLATQSLHLPARDALTATVLFAICNLLVLPFSGLLSDRIGRLPILLTAFTGYLLLSLPMFAFMVATKSFVAVAAVSVVAGILYGALNGVMPSALSELFPTHVRYTALSVGYNSAVMVFGGFAPFISTLLIKLSGSAMAPGFYVVFCAVISLSVALRLRARRSRLAAA